MNNSYNTTEDALLKFHHDVLWWKSIVEFIETEITFINKLLHSNAFETNQTNVFEKLDIFKHQMTIEMNALNNLKEIIDGHENKMRGMLDCEDLICDEVYLNNHHELKVQFEKFLRNFFECKSKIYRFIGGILKQY